MPITTFVPAQPPRTLKEIRLTRFGVYGEWTYANKQASESHNGHVTPDEVLAVVANVIEKYQLPPDHQVCVEYRNALTFAQCMAEGDYDRLLYSVMTVTTVVNLSDLPKHQQVH